MRQQILQKREESTLVYGIGPTTQNFDSETPPLINPMLDVGPCKDIVRGHDVGGRSALSHFGKFAVTNAHFAIELTQIANTRKRYTHYDDNEGRNICCLPLLLVGRRSRWS